MSDPFIVGSLIVLASIAVVVMIVCSTTPGIALLMRRTASSVELPLTTDAVLLAVERRARRSVFAPCIAVVAVCALGALGVLAGAGSDPHYYLEVAAVLVAAVTIASTVVAIRAQLFAPAADAVRIASATPRSVVDYLGRTRLVVCWVFVVAGAVVVGVSAVRGTAPAVAVVLAGASAVGLCLLPLVDRAILHAPQPATEPLELAWDDAYRMGTLADTRATLSCLSVLGASLATATDTSVQSLVLLLALVVLNIVFSRIPLPPALRPRWETHPEPAS